MAPDPVGFACAAEWQAECVDTLLRVNPKALLAVSAFPGLTQYELPFVVAKTEDDEYQACIQILEHGETMTITGKAKSKKRAEIAAAESACMELNKRGLLSDATGFLVWGRNPRQTLISSGIFRERSLPITVSSSGPGHKKVFVAELTLPLGDSEPYVAVGKATSKSEAENICCMEACRKLIEEPHLNPAVNDACNMAAYIHQQNEVAAFIELQDHFVSRIENALLEFRNVRKCEPVLLVQTSIVPEALAEKQNIEYINENVSASAKALDDKQKIDYTNENSVLASEAATRRVNLMDRMKHRQVLPIWSQKDKILQNIETQRVVVLTGATGSGKSTQVPQFILEDAETKGSGAETNIVVTQPRRVAAVSLAERVAWERRESLGRSVGYSIRLDSVLPRQYGSILFCTAGVFLWRLQRASELAVSHIIIDEAHVRDMATDCLLTVVRDLLSLRRTLRVIIMSATLDASIFTSYFNCCPHIIVPGRTYPVQVFFREDLQRLMNQQAVSDDDSESDVDCDFAASVITWVSNDFAQDDGAILCFLPGWATIMSLKDRLLRTESVKSMTIAPFHSRLSATEQHLAFRRAPTGMRKVVLATNIAETSVTIEDVVYVVDSGKMKEKSFRPSQNLATLKMRWTSQACALQRQGRAGRVRPGFCFRLYSKATFANMLEHQKPEMQCLPLNLLCLQIKALIIPDQGQGNIALNQDITAFLLKTIEPPAAVAISAGVNTLRQLGALDISEDLTPLGKVLAKLAVDPRYGKLLVYGALLGCEEMLTVAAASCFTDPFDFPVNRKEEAHAIRLNFATGYAFGSDQLTMVKIFDEYSAAESVGQGNEFCKRNFLSPVIMKLFKGMRRQFAAILQEHFPLEESFHKGPELARSLLVCGLSPNIARSAMCKESKGSKRIAHRWRLGFCMQAGRVLSHPISVVEEKNLDPSRHHFLVFEERVKSSQAFIRGCTLVPPVALIIFCGNVTERKDLASREGWTVLQVEFWLNLHVEEKTGSLLMQLREAFASIMHRWIGSNIHSVAEREVIQVILDLVCESTVSILC